MLSIAETLIDADPDEGISTDELIGVSGLSPEGVRAALYDLERLGIARNDTALTAFVHAGVDRHSRKRLEEADSLEVALIEHLRAAAPDLGKDDSSSLHLRVASQALRDAGEVDPLPERLLAGFRWILVDEYQDIDADQYALISALAGRTLDDGDRKLTLFAVGDDDQNIYAFNGASVEFIRRFEADYGPKPAFLTANYRSTGHIIAAANAGSCSRPRTAPRGWSSITWWCSTAAGTASARTKTRTPRAGSITWP